MHLREKCKRAQLKEQGHFGKDWASDTHEDVLELLIRSCRILNMYDKDSQKMPLRKQGVHFKGLLALTTIHSSFHYSP